MNGADVDDDELMERALLAYAQRSAARVGAEWFAAEFARRDEDERVEREDAMAWGATVEDAGPDMSGAGLIDASVEDDVVGGTPTGLGLAPTPPPATTHPDVPRPPVSEPKLEPKRRRRDRRTAPTATPSPAISAAEWARMSLGARRLYGMDASPGAADEA